MFPFNQLENRTWFMKKADLQPELIPDCPGFVVTEDEIVPVGAWVDIGLDF